MDTEHTTLPTGSSWPVTGRSWDTRHTCSCETGDPLTSDFGLGCSCQLGHNFLKLHCSWRLAFATALPSLSPSQVADLPCDLTVLPASSSCFSFSLTGVSPNKCLNVYFHHHVLLFGGRKLMQQCSSVFQDSSSLLLLVTVRGGLNSPTEIVHLFFSSQFCPFLLHIFF